MKEKKDFLKGLIAGILTACILISLVSLMLRMRTGAGAGASGTSNQEAVFDGKSLEKKLEQLNDIVDQYYLSEPDQKALENGAYKGFLEGLGDPYSVYYTKEEYARLMESSNGEYSGIGVLLTKDVETKEVVVVKPYENAPAWEAGMEKGDVLLEVDGTPITEMDLSSAVALIKEGKDSTVTIRAYRASTKEYKDFTIVKRKIEIPTVSAEMMEGDIGYIQITEFDKVTLDQFKEAFVSLQDQGMKGLLVDLRDNPGGMVVTVCSILDYILPEGLIVYTEDKDGKRNEYKSDAERQLGLPLAVLVNENSASASEIFAGAVRDYGVGTIVGKKTYGKGVVQSVIGLADGDAVKITVANYYTPKGNNIHGVGIEPDLAVEPGEKQYGLNTKVIAEDSQLTAGLEVLKTQLR